jgi:hypothetical protein
MLKRDTVIAFAVCFLTLFGQTGSMASETGGIDAVVVIIHGTARIYAKGATTGLPLKKGDHISKDQEIAIAEKSRIELKFPDGTVMRLSEKSRLRMNELAFNKQTDQKNVKVGLSTGKLWAKVRKLITPNSSVEVITQNAVAGVRGTIYRINVEDDKSAMVKVYDGSVYVSNPPRDATQPINMVTMPHEVSGPHEIPKPVHEVSMEEWTVIVKAMQQITISPQGVASKPQDFDPKADADDWVIWNQIRDKETSL